MFHGADSGTCGHGAEAMVVNLATLARGAVVGIAGLTFTGRSRHFAVDFGSTALANEAALHKDGDSHHKITHGSSPKQEMCGVRCRRSLQQAKHSPAMIQSTPLPE